MLFLSCGGKIKRGYFNEFYVKNSKRTTFSFYYFALLSSSARHDSPGEVGNRVARSQIFPGTVINPNRNCNGSKQIHLT